MELVSVAAVAENLVIGDGEDVPWDLPADVEQYRERVDGHPVIVGRRTYEMYSDPPGSAQIVMSRSEREFDRDTAYHAGSVDEAIDLAESMDSESTGSEAVYVIGGGAVYEALQPHLDRMVLTRVPGEYEGDVYYPEWDEADWELVSTEDYPEFTVETWERRNEQSQ